MILLSQASQMFSVFSYCTMQKRRLIGLLGLEPSKKALKKLLASKWVSNFLVGIFMLKASKKMKLIRT